MSIPVITNSQLTALANPANGAEQRIRNICVALEVEATKSAEARELVEQYMTEVQTLIQSLLP